MADEISFIGDVSYRFGDKTVDSATLRTGVDYVVSSGYGAQGSIGMERFFDGGPMTYSIDLHGYRRFEGATAGLYYARQDGDQGIPATAYYGVEGLFFTGPITIEAKFGRVDPEGAGSGSSVELAGYYDLGNTFVVGAGAGRMSDSSGDLDRYFVKASYANILPNNGISVYGKISKYEAASVFDETSVEIGAEWLFGRSDVDRPKLSKPGFLLDF